MATSDVEILADRLFAMFFKENLFAFADVFNVYGSRKTELEGSGSTYHVRS